MPALSRNFLFFSPDIFQSSLRGLVFEKSLSHHKQQTYAKYPTQATSTSTSPPPRSRGTSSACPRPCTWKSRPTASQPAASYRTRPCPTNQTPPSPWGPTRRTRTTASCSTLPRNPSRSTRGPCPCARSSLFRTRTRNSIWRLRVRSRRFSFTAGALSMCRRWRRVRGKRCRRGRGGVGFVWSRVGMSMRRGGRSGGGCVG